MKSWIWLLHYVIAEGTTGIKVVINFQNGTMGSKEIELFVSPSTTGLPADYDQLIIILVGM